MAVLPPAPPPLDPPLRTVMLGFGLGLKANIFGLSLGLGFAEPCLVSGGFVNVVM